MESCSRRLAVSQILTIGYEGASLADFLSTLERSHVTEVVDVRQRASSRRPGFAKTALSAALHAAGIAYRHVRMLGTPVELRRELSRERNYPRFLTRFADYLGTRSGDIEQLGNSAAGRIALLCFERDPACCHRSMVAASLSRYTGAPVLDLWV